METIVGTVSGKVALKVYGYNCGIIGHVFLYQAGVPLGLDNVSLVRYLPIQKGWPQMAPEGPLKMEIMEIITLCYCIFTASHEDIMLFRSRIRQFKTDCEPRDLL